MYRKQDRLLQMAVELLSLCLDHHKFSLKTNLRAPFNFQQRFTDQVGDKEKPWIPKITTILDFRIGAERALNGEDMKNTTPVHIQSEKLLSICR